MISAFVLRELAEDVRNAFRRQLRLSPVDGFTE
jgi:hypothetical protein